MDNLLHITLLEPTDYQFQNKNSCIGKNLFLHKNNTRRFLEKLGTVNGKAIVVIRQVQFPNFFEKDFLWMIPIFSTLEAIECINEYGRMRIPFLFVIDFLAKSPIVIPLSQINNKRLLYNFNGQTNHPNDTSYPILQPFGFHKSPISFVDYQTKFEYVVSQIKRGNSFLTNLSACTKIGTDLDLKTIFVKINW